MAISLFRHAFARLRLRSLLKTSFNRSILHLPEPVFSLSRPLMPLNISNPWWVFKNFSHGTVDFVISGGTPKFETHETDPPTKYKFLIKKRLKVKSRKERQKRKFENHRDPRRREGKRRKQRFANAEQRIKYNLKKAKIKEGLLVERLKRYEVPKVQGPLVQPDELTGEERYYMTKMAQKRSNYAPVGRRGVFGGVVLNMHMHWKKHETVKVICKPCKPGQVQEYASDIARLSGGTPIHIIGNDTIIFYRGKNYVQPRVMSPIDTLSKKRALEKSKYEQALETVRHFIAISEKELELYYRHIALYGDPSNRNSTFDSLQRGMERSKKVKMIERGHSDSIVTGSSGTKSVSADDDSSENEDGYESGGLSLSDLDEDGGISSNDDSCDEDSEDSTSNIKEI